MTFVSDLPQEDPRRERILHHAIQAFLKQGYAGTSVETIAMDAGVSKVTIYRLFQDKAELAAAVLRTLAHSLDLACRGALVMDAPAPESLERFGIAYVRWMLRPIGRTHNYQVTRLTMEMSAIHPEGLRLWMEQNRAITSEPLERYITRRIECGELGGEHPAFIASQFMTSMFGASAQAAIAATRPRGEERLPIEDLVKRKVRMFLRGCTVACLDAG